MIYNIFTFTAEVFLFVVFLILVLYLIVRNELIYYVALGVGAFGFAFALAGCRDTNFTSLVLFAIASNLNGTVIRRIYEDANC